MLRRYKILFDKAEEGKGGGGGTGYEADPTVVTPPATPPPEAKAPADPAASKAAGDNLDELGYEKPKVDDKGKEDKEPGKEDPKKPVEEEITPASGYEEVDEEEKPEKPEDKKPDPEKPKDDLGYELKVEGLDDKELSKVKDFAKEHKLSKEQAEGLAKLRKSDLDALNSRAEQAKVENENKVKETKKQWRTELLNDPVFGGDREKFDKSLHMVEKVLKDFMPETKKVLTERKSMLPPYVMRDILGFGKAVYSNEAFVNGEEGKPAAPKAEVKANAHLDFYNS